MSEEDRKHADANASEYRDNTYARVDRALNACEPRKDVLMCIRHIRQAAASATSVQKSVW
ncbi:hypothetical protein OUZ56_003003 [Daphnia magna]|uniref:Uncharacterized protein n=1 Tax=Daphnia magna TaxID=35525 RepID=A0ABR0A7G0_9CRUS|nr:hypothetical protein OUZ56_003003 [Daphnia magna]